ncbi:MAG: sulfotransferase family 2 domain-containing protein [Rhizobiales bacterium]|nr:sulfotransferase family 2 domain-containing protein [Hyphomicrobiales bacterium]
MLSFNLLTNQSFQEYVRAPRRTGFIWLLHHIPKTAGSSIIRELQICLAPYRNIHSKYHVNEGNDEQQRKRDRLLLEAVDAFLQEHASVHYRSASGHLNLSHLRAIRAALPHAQFFTILRDPVKRVISDFRYCRTPKHPPHKDFIERYPTIKDYVLAPESQDKMWNYVTEGEFVPDEEGLNKIFDRYAFIGTLEELTLCFEFFTALTGCPKTPAFKRNQTQSTDDNIVSESAETIELIRANNGKDIIFYDEVSSRLARIRGHMQSYVDRRRSMFAGEQPEVTTPSQ